MSEVTKKKRGKKEELSTITFILPVKQKKKIVKYCKSEGTNMSRFFREKMDDILAAL